jgi:hypothetical protein
MSASAEDRAFRLLMRNLSAAQREQYRRYAYFEVVGGDTGKRYRIHRGWQMNVEEYDGKGRRIRLLCFMPRGGVPVSDVMLGQKIALELFESDALMVAHQAPAWHGVMISEAGVGRSNRQH